MTYIFRILKVYRNGGNISSGMPECVRRSGPDCKRDGLTRGSALVVVLWVVGILSMLVLSFAFTMHIETRITSTWRKRLKAEYLAHSGIELAKMALSETADPDMDIDDTLVYLTKGDDREFRSAVVTLAQGGGATIRKNIGTNTISVQITPENARMDINSMIFVDDRDRTYLDWENIFRVADIPRHDRDALVDCLLDWVDENDFTRLNGAESAYYQTLDPPYNAKNGPIDTVDELALIKGFDEEIGDTGKTVYEAIAGLLTCYGTPDRININAVGVGAIMAFLHVDEQIAEMVVKERAGPDGIEGTEDDLPFRDINDFLTRVPVFDESITRYITFGSTGLYKIESTGSVGIVDYTISCVVRWEDNRFLFLEWLETGSDI